MVSGDVRESETVKIAETSSSNGFRGDLAVHVQPWAMLSKGLKKSGRQDSNLQNAPYSQALTTAAPQLAPQCCKLPEEVEEIALAWAGLPDSLKAAVLGIVRSVGKEGK
jgi:hypothetical protein